MTKDTTTRPYRILIDEVIMKENPNFQVIWEGNLSIDDLFRRWQMQQSDIINSKFLPTYLPTYLPA
jgi:hypothetical protein